MAAASDVPDGNLVCNRSLGVAAGRASFQVLQSDAPKPPAEGVRSRCGSAEVPFTHAQITPEMAAGWPHAPGARAPTRAGLGPQPFRDAVRPAVSHDDDRQGLPDLARFSSCAIWFSPRTGRCRSRPAHPGMVWTRLGKPAYARMGPPGAYSYRYAISAWSAPTTAVGLPRSARGRYRHRATGHHHDGASGEQRRQCAVAVMGHSCRQV